MYPELVRYAATTRPAGSRDPGTRSRASSWFRGRRSADLITDTAPMVPLVSLGGADRAA